MIRARALLTPALSMVAVLTFSLPAAASADMPQIDRAARFVEVVRANDCRLSEAEGAVLLPSAGLSMEDARDAVALLNRGPLFTVSDDLEHLVLTPALCAADDAETLALLAEAESAPPRLRLLTLADRVDPAEAARLIGHIRANDCALTEGEAAAQMPGLGFSQEAVQDILSVLAQSELAMIDAGRLALAPALCTATGAQDTARIAALLADMPGAGEGAP